MNRYAPVFSRPHDFIVALLLIAAFAWAGWKIVNRLPVPEFASVVQQSFALQATPALVSAASLPAQQPSSYGRFNHDARFVSFAPGRAVHAASLVELHDGRSRAVWFSGSREGAGDVSIKTSVLDAVNLR